MTPKKVDTISGLRVSGVSGGNHVMVMVTAAASSSSVAIRTAVVYIYGLSAVSSSGFVLFLVDLEVCSSPLLLDRSQEKGTRLICRLGARTPFQLKPKAAVQESTWRACRCHPRQYTSGPEAHADRPAQFVWSPILQCFPRPERERGEMQHAGYHCYNRLSSQL